MLAKEDLRAVRLKSEEWMASVRAVLKNKQKSSVLLAGIMLLSLVTYVDVITGWQVSVSVFYILPIVLVAWCVQRPAGLLMAGLSTITSAVAEFSWDIPYQTFLTPLWNNLSRFTFFALIAVLISKLKYQLETLEQTVADRTSSLSKEVAIRKQAEQELRRSNETLTQHQKQLQLLAMELAKTEEKERRSIATMLHDQLGQNLSYVKMQIGDLCDQAPSPQAGSILGRISAVLDKSIEDIRSLAFEISPPVLDEIGLEAALEWQGEQLLEKYGLRVELTSQGTGTSIGKDIRVTLFQVVRELLINIAKHAATERAWVDLRTGAGSLQIEVRDAGAGFDVSGMNAPDSRRKGFGLFNIRQRIACLGGNVSIRSYPNQGTTVTVSVPLADQPKLQSVEGDA
jgi:signal transduction histidine kinase